MKILLAQIPGVVRFICLVFLGFSANAVSLRGVVEHSAGEVIAGANVWVAQEAGIQRRETDSEGRFTYSDLAVGQTHVTAYKTGHALGGISDILVSDAEIKIVLGDAEPVTLHLVDSDGGPVAGASLRYLAVNDTFAVLPDALAEYGFPAWRSNDDGDLTLIGLPAGGFFKCVISHYRFADTKVPFLPVAKGPHTVLLPRGWPLAGRVSHEDHGIAGATVILFAQTSQGPKEMSVVQTDPEGYYRARVAQPGAYSVLAWHRDYGRPKPVMVRLTDASKEASLDLNLPAARFIEGVVGVSRDEPCPGVKIVYEAKDALPDETYTDSAGHFALKTGHLEGTLRIEPPQGFVTEAMPDIQVSMGDKTRIELAPTRLLRLPLITGVILDAAGGPAAGAVVTALDEVRPKRVLCDGEGRFQMAFNEMPDEKKLPFRAEHPSLFQRADFNVNAKRRDAVRVTLKEFVPDLTPRPAHAGIQYLVTLIGKSVPKLACRKWFNTADGAAPDLEGKTVVLTFWAGFDDSPQGIRRADELRTLRAVYREAEDVLFVGVHDGLSEDKAVAGYIEEGGIDFPVGLDEDAAITFKRFGITEIPQTVLIDPSGKIRFCQVEGRLLELIKAIRRAP